MFCFGQFTNENIEKNSIELLNDITNSSDYSHQIASFNKDKNDTDFNGTYYTIKPDSFFSDTIRTTMYRISFPDFTGVLETDTLFILNQPCPMRYKVDKVDDFSPTDTLSFVAQTRIANDLKWDSRIRCNGIVDKKYIDRMFTNDVKKGWKTYYSKYGRGYFQFSIPLFNVDFDVALISLEFNSGRVCEYGGTYLCKKIHGKWVITRTYSVWMS